MNKILAILAIFFNLTLITQIANADPREHNGNGYAKRDQSRQNYKEGRSEDQLLEKRREREERGVRRLQQHKWQAGYVMPQHYRGDGYKVEYREYNLSKPSRNQQWYKINNDFILVNTENNSIIQIMSL